MMKISLSQVTSLEFKKAVIAVGGKPVTLSELECKGAEYAITSDDVFFMTERPKKILVLGGGYIAMECASYFKKLGSEVVVMVRSVPMRVYDPQVSEYVLKYMTEDGVEFINQSLPTEIKKNSNGSFDVVYKNDKGEAAVLEKVDTVLSAISRRPYFDQLNLSVLPGIKQTNSHKLIGGVNGEQERIHENIYAVGDCLEGPPELTPIAIRFGRFLAKKLDKQIKGEEPKELNFDYKFFPSTVFTYPEYSFCGYNEPEARKKFGSDKVKAYHGLASVLEWAMILESPKAYFKAVCLIQPDGQEKVIGLHYVGPNAGEVMQGWAVF